MGAISKFAKTATKEIGSEIGKGMASAIGGKIVETGLGFLLDAVGLGDPDGPTLENQEKQIEIAEDQLKEQKKLGKLSEEQLRVQEESLNTLKESLAVQRKSLTELYQVNKNLVDLKHELEEIDQELQTQTKILRDILGQEVFQSWELAFAESARAINAIQAEFKNYRIYTTPVLNSKGEVSQFPASRRTLDAFVDRILFANGSIDRALTIVQNGINGNTPESNVLVLYANVLKDQVVFSNNIDQEGEYSQLLNSVMQQLIAFYRNLLASQFQAISLIVDAHNYQKEVHIANDKWNDYIENIKLQEKSFFKAAWIIINTWVSAWAQNSYTGKRVTMPGSFLVPPLQSDRTFPGDHAVKGLKVMSKKDVFDYATLTEASPETLQASYGEFIYSPEQPWWTEIEELIASFVLANPGSARMVTHIPMYGGNSFLNSPNPNVFDQTQLFEGEIPAFTKIIDNDGNENLKALDPKDNFFINRNSNRPGDYKQALIRQTIDLTGLEEGQDCMVDFDKKLNEIFPEKHLVYTVSTRGNSMRFLATEALSWTGKGGEEFTSKQLITKSAEGLALASFHLVPYSVVE